MNGADLPPLGWLSPEPYDPAYWTPIEGNAVYTVKPLGGLWSAPIEDDGRSSWQHWCEDEDYGDHTRPLYRVTPDPDARVFVIDGLEDLLRLEQAYPGNLPDGYPMWVNLSWTKVAAEFDAVYLTGEGQWRTRFSNPGLYGWDCATVLWLQPRFTIEGLDIGGPES